MFYNSFLKLGIDKKKLLVTVFNEDEDAYNLWKTIAGLDDDKIIKINDKKIDGNLSDIFKDCKKEVTLTIKKKFSQKSISLSVGNYYQLLEIIKNKNATDEQLTLRKVWCNN